MAIFEYKDGDGHICHGIRVVVKDPYLTGKRIQRQRLLGPIGKKAAKIQERILRDQTKREFLERRLSGISWSELLHQFDAAVMNEPSRISEANELTIHDYAVSLRKHTSKWADRAVTSIGQNDVALLFRDFDQAGLSASRKRHMRTSINLLFDWGVRERLLPTSIVSPAKGISIGKKLKVRQPILTLNQIRQFLDEAAKLRHEFYEVWSVAFLTGMRSGELYALRWSDICLETKTIRVERSYNKRRNIEKSTKSGEWRDVPINGQLEALLARLRIRTGATGFVLPRINSWRRGEASKVTRSFCQSIGIPEINFHATRACFAVQMLDAGVSVPKVMAIGGWAEFKSFQHYLRLAGVDIRQATEGLKLLPIEVESARILGLK